MRRVIDARLLFLLVAGPLPGCADTKTVYGGGQLNVVFSDASSGVELLSVVIPGIDAERLPPNHETSHCADLAEYASLVARHEASDDHLSLEACVTLGSEAIASGQPCGEGYSVLRFNLVIERASLFGAGAITFTDSTARGLSLGFDPSFEALSEGPPAVEIDDAYDVMEATVEDEVHGELHITSATWRCPGGEELATTEVAISWAFDPEVSRPAVTFTDEP